MRQVSHNQVLRLSRYLRWCAWHLTGVVQEGTCTVTANARHWRTDTQHRGAAPTDMLSSPNHASTLIGRASGAICTS